MARETQKSIFVTGAASGIGRATAQLFAEKGWFVGLFDIDAEGLEETAALLPEGQRISMLLDVRDRAAWARAIDAFSQVTGRRLDVLFNNAGVGLGGLLEDMRDEDIDLVLDVNLKGVINGVRAALPLLRETPGARIVNTASVAGFIATPKISIYSATKFAVCGLTEALDAEFATYGIRVTSLMPWFVDTPILDNAGSDTGRTLRQALAKSKMPVYPAHVAAQRAWDAAHGSDVHYLVGREAKQAHLMARLFPNMVRKRARRGLGD